MATGATQVATCVKYKEVGETANTVFEDMITNISFDHNTAAMTDLTGLMLGYDMGYGFHNFV